MNNPGLRPTVKNLVPPSIRKVIRRSMTYVDRLRTWSSVLTEIRGATSADQTVLSNSSRRGRRAARLDLDLWQDPQLVADATVAVGEIGSFHVRAFSDDLYHVLPSREPSVVTAIRAGLREGSTFVDAGANIGFFTILAARIVGPSGRVYAIEMLPATAERLKLNIAENGLTNITVLEHAVSATSGEEVVATVPLHKFGRASIVKDAGGESYSRIAVKTRTLDELFGSISGTIDMMKMDLEGAEAIALKGATRTLKRTRAIIFEQLPGDADAASLLGESGFRLRMLDRNNILAERS